MHLFSRFFYLLLQKVQITDNQHYMFYYFPMQNIFLTPIYVFVSA